MKLDELDLAETHTAHVLDNTLLTPPAAAEEVRELVLTVDGDGLHFEIGQSIAVLAPPGGAFGESRHVRLYTVAQAPAIDQRNPEIHICVRRCSYLDPYSGEEFAGVASNFLCDRSAGDRIEVAGPYGVAFRIPDDPDSDLLMIGLGTGIAPFRAFVRHIYQNTDGGWRGKVRVLHGARTGLEMIYRNEQRDDFASYMDEDTFAAFEALSPRPGWEDPVDFSAALDAHRDEVWEMIRAPDTYVFVAGLEPIRDALDAAFADMAGSEEKWQRRKAELIAGKRWAELIY